MTDTNNWKTAKWPFLLGDALLMAIAYFFIQHAHHPIGHLEIIVASICVALGAILGCLPFIFDYRAITKLIETQALGSISEKIKSLETLAAQISAATNEWTNAQAQAEKTSAGAKQISEKMSDEVRQFTEFMKKMNDSEKSALRLEVEKMQRGQSEWLQVIVRILDHVFLLHTAAARSNQPKVAEQISNFQNACRDAARRIGLGVFTAESGETFDSQKHQDAEGETNVLKDSTIAETVGIGFTFQGKLLRPALVKLNEPKIEAEEPKDDTTGDTIRIPLPDQS